MKIKRIGILLALVAALAFAAGSAVVAYADQAASQIYACVNNSSGTIHVIDAMAACNSNEVKLVWNTQGPQGAKGDTGPQGFKGDTGAQGVQGIQGPAGANGVSGYTQVTAEFTVPSSTAELRAWATCPVGTVVLGGGPWRFTNPNDGDIVPTVTQSAPTSTTTWEVKIDNAGSARRWDYALVLTCARAN